MRLYEGLKHSGWMLNPPMSVSASNDDVLPAILAIGASATGLTVNVRLIPPTGDTPFKTLRDTLTKMRVAISGGAIIGLPEGFVRIVVGPKP
jgi:hypothetical protein